MKKRLFPSRPLMLPLNPLFRLALGCRDLLFRSGLEPTHRLRWPVISIGNLSTGGSGKTPLTIALAKALIARGVHVDVLSRGYGRKSDLPLRVHPDGSAEQFGDEPLLIAQETKAPVYVAPRRFEAGLLAESDAEALDRAARIKKEAKAKADLEAKTVAQQPQPAQPAPAQEPEAAPASVHLLDDGFQHRQLDRAVDILLVDRHDWQDWLLPAGNLREPRLAAHRASVLAIPAEEADLETALRVWGWQGPLWKLHRKFEIPACNGPVAAFCGIARPDRFFLALAALGVEVAAQFAFPDHYVYTPGILEQMQEEARQKGAKTIITTSKDLVRLGKLATTFPASMPLAVSRLRIEIESQDAVLDWLTDRLGFKPLAPDPVAENVGAGGPVGGV